MPDFWRGGPEAYETALRQEYRAKVQVLKQRLREAQTTVEAWQIRAELRELGAELRRRLRAGDGSVF